MMRFEVLEIAFFKLLMQGIECCDTRTLGHGGVAGFGLAVNHNLFGLRGVGDYLEAIADLGQVVKTDNFDGH